MKATLQPKDMPHIVDGGHHPLTRHELGRLITQAREVVATKRMDYYVSRCFLLRVAQAVPGYTNPLRRPYGHQVKCAVEESKALFTSIVFEPRNLSDLAKLEGLLGIDTGDQATLALAASDWSPTNGEAVVA